MNWKYKYNFTNQNGKVCTTINGIARFVQDEGYTGNFGIQWNQFKSTQLDSKNGTTLTHDRFFSGTQWNPKDLDGKTVLEAGCGAGRFTEVLLEAGARVVAFDYSNAVEACYKNNGHQDNLILFQGDIYNIPLHKESFDFIFCYGVLQHTPDPKKAFENLIRYLKPGGQIAIDCYLKDGKIYPWKSKYIWRPLTTRLPPKSLFKFLKFFIPLWLPIDTVIKYIPILGRYLGSIIPCWNYTHIKKFSYKQRLEWAVMDTFDALAPAYDLPQTLEDIRGWLQEARLKVDFVRLGGNGIEARGTR